MKKIPNGTGVFFVDVERSGTNFKSNMTYAQILNAFNTGSLPVIRYKDDPLITIANMNGYEPSTGITFRGYDGYPIITINKDGLQYTD